MVHQDERRSTRIVEDWRTGLLGRLQSNREAVESGRSIIVWDSRLKISICPVARAAVFQPPISVDPNVIKRADSSLVASLSSVHGTIEDVRTLQCPTNCE
jgi:transposase